MPKICFQSILAIVFLLSLWGCSSSSDNVDDGPVETPPLLAVNGILAIEIQLPEDAEDGLMDAAQDLRSAMQAITGAALEPPSDSGTPIIRRFIRVEWIDSSEYGPQGFSIAPFANGDKEAGLTVTAAGQTGAMYGLYQIAHDLGARYYHPEESFFPSDSAATLPWDYGNAIITPRFDKRGFHEHTQHPIIASDWYLKGEQGELREYLSNYIRWMARNRQNMMSFHMLKTVDLENWWSYISSVIAEAHKYDIEVGCVVSFVDQQQNGFKIIREDYVDPDSGETVADEVQIRETLDQFARADFDFLGLQIGSSEFTKPADSDMLEWLDIAVGYLAESYPNIDAFAWIHTTCDLESETGGYYYHLPLQADTNLGAFVHTTMFYDMEHDAPVYSCETFHQQRDFIEEADGKRELVYFPETAWWLGFDNNAPLVLPIYGYSRDYDMTEILPNYDISGHVTFTSGREWTYWMYDHFLTQSTFDASITWERYLDWLKPLYGERGESLIGMLKAMGDLQVKHFYEENPLIYFYIAGELQQDEIGEQAGILARRPKPALKKILALEDSEFSTWKSTDYDYLETMLTEYQAAFEGLEASVSAESEADCRLSELSVGLDVYAHRIEHVLAIYAGVIAARDWDKEKKRAIAAEEEPDAAIKTQAQQSAEAELAKAKAITEEMLSYFNDMENCYRYPAEYLCREKDSLTSYQFGYIWQTSTGHFWTRRDDQLESLIGQVFDTLVEDWENVPDALFITDKDHTRVTQPDDILAGSVISGFMPQMLFGIRNVSVQSGTMDLIVAQDYNQNLTPDPESEQTISGTLDGTNWDATSLLFSITVHDASGNEIGDLSLFEPTYHLDLALSDEQVSAISLGTIDGEIVAQELIDIVMTVGGIDQEGSANLIKGIYGIETDQALPERLPAAFEFTFEKAAF